MAATPQWVIDALMALGNGGTNVSRQAKLGLGAASQGIANQLGYPIPSAQQESSFPFGSWGSPPAVKHDLGAEQFRSTLDSDLSVAANAYINQVPVGSVWTDRAPLGNTQWNAQHNPSVGSDGWRAGMKSESVAPGLPAFSAVYTGRPSPQAGTPGQPEQGYWEHQNHSNDGNESTQDIWHVTQPATPGTPGTADPSTTSIPLEAQQQFGLKVSLYNAILKQAGGINRSQFDQDLVEYIRQDPMILEDIAFLNKPFYKDMSDEAKLDQAWSKLGAKYGAQLKNTPIGHHYEGILK